MSWLARSIVNSLKLDDDDDDHHDRHVDDEQSPSPSKSKQQSPSQSQSSSPSSPSQSQPERGVKEDLSELTKTLTRQFWGVASFLAPPVDSDSSAGNTDSNQSDLRADRDRGTIADEDGGDDEVVGVSGIRSDFAEIGGKVKSGISKLSGNIAVSEITKIASSFLQFKSDHDAVGVTEEVISFAKNIALHPETWLDFPLSDDDEDSDDFDMSDAQQEHALAVERLVPELTAIRIEICPEYLSEDNFWKIYFLLLHPRLNKDDAVLLSTPQIMKARAMLTHELPSRMKAEPELSTGHATFSNKTNISSHEEQLSVPAPVTQQDSPPLKTFVPKSATTVEPTRSDQNSRVVVIDKSVVENQTKDDDAVSASSIVMVEKYEDDGDDWLKEESSEPGETNESTIPVGNDEDVSFSDLEDDDEDVPTSQTRK